MYLLLRADQRLKQNHDDALLPAHLQQEHRDPNNIDLEAPRLACYNQKTWKRHQDTVYWVDINLAQKKRIEVLSNKM